MQESKVFAKKRSQTHASSIRPSADKTPVLSLLSAGCHYTGKMMMAGNVRIGGIVEGSIHSTGSLVIEESATVRGEIYGNIVTIIGAVEGKISASNLLRVTQKGRISGIAMAHKINVEEGADVVCQFVRWEQ